MKKNITCQECWGEVPANSKFCMHCGYQIKVPSNSEVSEILQQKHWGYEGVISVKEMFIAPSSKNQVLVFINDDGMPESIYKRNEKILKEEREFRAYALKYCGYKMNFRDSKGKMIESIDGTTNENELTYTYANRFDVVRHGEVKKFVLINKAVKNTNTSIISLVMKSKEEDVPVSIEFQETIEFADTRQSKIISNIMKELIEI